MALSALQDKLGLTTKDQNVERQLDDAVAESFPASDPVSLAQPHDRGELGATGPRFSQTTWFILGGGLLAALAVLILRR